VTVDECGKGAEQNAGLIYRDLRGPIRPVHIPIYCSSDDLPLDVQNESAWAEKWLSADFGKTV
jgi:hypothetical protein